MKSKLLLALLALAIAGTASAQLKVHDAIKIRQSGYTFMAWNMGKLKGMLIDNPASFNKDQAIAAANLIAATANSGMGRFMCRVATRARAGSKPAPSQRYLLIKKVSARWPWLSTRKPMNWPKLPLPAMRLR